MPPVYPQSPMMVAKVSLFGALVGAPFVLWVCLVYTHSSYGTSVDRVQPGLSSHEQYVGIPENDCRYGYPSVENSPYASLPLTRTCMDCPPRISDQP